MEEVFAVLDIVDMSINCFIGEGAVGGGGDGEGDAGDEKGIARGLVLYLYFMAGDAARDGFDLNLWPAQGGACAVEDVDIEVGGEQGEGDDRAPPAEGGINDAQDHKHEHKLIGDPAIPTHQLFLAQRELSFAVGWFFFGSGMNSHKCWMLSKGKRLLVL